MMPRATSCTLSGLVLSALLAGSGAPLAGAPSQRDTIAPPSPQTARLSGRVVDAADRLRPVRRAIVTITGGRLPAGRSAITDDDGRFLFAHVPAGEFTMSATRPGFITATYGAPRPGRPGTPIVVVTGRDVPDIPLVMSHGSAIDGVLRDTVGDPAPGMRVEAVRLIPGPSGARGETAGVSLTDDRGEYRIFGLQAGEYVLAATPAAVISGIGEIGAPSESDVDALLAWLQRRTGGPAPVSPSPGAPTPVEPPAMKGYSTPATFYPGVVASGEATRITVGTNDDREGVDFALRLSHAAAIDGVIVPVRDQNQSLPQLQIAIRGDGPDLPVFGGSAGGPSVSLRQADRTFHISNVPPGRYHITARTFGAPGSSTAVISSGGAIRSPDPAAGVQWATTDVDIAGDDLSGITLTLQPAPRVSGRLTFEASSITPPDAGGLRVVLEPVADDQGTSNGLSTPLTATSGRDGTFEFPAVLPGAYRLTAAASGAWWLRSALLDARDVLDDGFHVGATDVSGLVLTVSDRHTAIAGTLSGNGGRPATAYVVIAFPTDRAMWRPGSRRVLSGRPSTTGAFELKDLPPGTYHLAVLADVEPADLADASFLASVVPAALTVTLGEGERVVQNMRIGGG